MKTLFLSLSFLVSSVGAFSPSFGRARSSSSNNNVMIRHAQPQSVTEAIQAALDASRKYGATSPEAQVLWDAVEEMNASDNSAAYATPSLDDECELEEETLQPLSPECVEYGEQMEELENLKIKYSSGIADSLQKNAVMSSPAFNNLSEVKLSSSGEKDGTTTRVNGYSNVVLQQALAHAQSCNKEFGLDHPQTKLAYEALEEVSASMNNPVTGTDPLECDVDLMSEACLALEAFHQFLEETK